MPGQTRIFDTTKLIKQFRRLQPYHPKTAGDARKCADDLIDLYDTDAIVSPVEIEMIAGVVDRHEMDLTMAFLDRFLILDHRSILPEDWMEARRIAKHIGFDAGRRQLGDCLIEAIANRLHCVVLSDDRDLIRQRGTTRQRGT